MTAVRLVGAILGATISLSTALLPGSDVPWLGPTFQLEGIGMYGAPVAAPLGWWLGPHAVRASWPRAIGIGLGMGLAAAPLGAWLFAYLGLIGSLVGADGGSGLMISLFVATIGPFYAIAVLPITIPAGLIWAIVMGAVVRPLAPPRDLAVAPSPFTLTHLGALLLIGALLAALVGMVRP
jgi:hypothetical protein